MVQPNEDELLVEEILARGELKLAPNERLEVVQFGELQEGDVLVGSTGRTTITQAFEPHVPESMFELETSEGEKLELSGNHLIYVITATDRGLHKQRLAEGRTIGKQLLPEVVEELEELASKEVEGNSESFITDFETMLKPTEANRAAVRKLLIRIAESLGPVSESNFYIDELEGRESTQVTRVSRYNRALFAQQLLSIMNIKKYRKKWKPVIGTVMTVEALTNYDLSEIYIPAPATLTRGETV